MRMVGLSIGDARWIQIGCVGAFSQASGIEKRCTSLYDTLYSLLR